MLQVETIHFAIVPEEPVVRIVKVLDEHFAQQQLSAALSLYYSGNDVLLDLSCLPCAVCYRRLLLILAATLIRRTVREGDSMLIYSLPLARKSLDIS